LTGRTLASLSAYGNSLMLRNDTDLLRIEGHADTEESSPAPEAEKPTEDGIKIRGSMKQPAP